ncbi:uncharacterized protein LOC144172641 isoform X2 [Haemaphysalis longicornis]
MIVCGNLGSSRKIEHCVLRTKNPRPAQKTLYTKAAVETENSFLQFLQKPPHRPQQTARQQRL